MKPIHVADAPPFRLEVHYQKEHHRFRVSIFRDDLVQMIQYIPATYEPLFGIDASDMKAINDEAESMCLALESGK